MNTSTVTKAVIRPTAQAVGFPQYQALSRMLKLEAILDFCIASRTLTTYKPVAIACGWHWRDQLFHEALGDISRSCIARGEAAKSAVVCRVDNRGQADRPGIALFNLLAYERGFTISTLTNGDLDPTEIETLWQDEMKALGYEPQDLI